MRTFFFTDERYLSLVAANNKGQLLSLKTGHKRSDFIFQLKTKIFLTRVLTKVPAKEFYPPWPKVAFGVVNFLKVTWYHCRCLFVKRFSWHFRILTESVTNFIFQVTFSFKFCIVVYSSVNSVIFWNQSRFFTLSTLTAVTNKCV